MKKHLVNLKDYLEDRIQIQDISKILNENIPIEDFFRLSPHHLAYSALTLFNFRRLEKNNDSIEKYCQILLNKTGILKKLEDPITAFLAIFLEVGKNIIEIKNELEQKARAHLKQVEEILDFYGTLSFVKKFRLEPLKPTNNQERMEMEFYKRALTKKEEIIEYIIRGVLFKAKEKSAHLKSDRPVGLKEIFEQLDFNEDFPYTELLYQTHKIAYDLNLEKIDFRRINPLKNKMEWLDPKNLYAGNYSKEINEGFERKIKNSTLFKKMISTLKRIPIIQNREDIFEEMEFLFKNKKWNGLYALALPQVEGIFTEMIALTDNKKIRKSLTDKAKTIRDYYGDSHFTMDYYEFTLANLRNSFAHTGKVENPKEKSHHVLLDIHYLLNICIELDTPVAKLSKLISDGYGQINHIEKLATLLELIDDVNKENKMSTIKTLLENFVYEEVLENVDLKNMVIKLERDFEKFANEYEEKLMLVLYDQTPFHIFSLSQNEIKFHAKIINEKTEEFIFIIGNLYKLLLDTYTFLYKFPKYFPKIPTILKIQIEEFKNRQSQKLKCINLLKQYINFDSKGFMDIYQKEL